MAVAALRATTEAVAPGGYAIAGVALRGVVSALPSGRITNDRFVAQFGDKVVADVVKMVGVETRYWVDGDTTAGDLCQAAAERLLDRLGWARDSVDALIFVSQTPDHRLPATSCVLHGKLDLAPHCQAFDVGLGCSGYVYGLWLGSGLINAGLRRVLVLAGDTSSQILAPEDRATTMLFGDAGSATALEADRAAPAMHFRLGSDGKGAERLIVPGGGYRTPAASAYLNMDGGEVFTFTLRAVPRLISDLLADSDVAVGAVDVFLLHQANRFMLRHLAKKIGASEACVPINIDRFGNTSSATIPLLLTTDVAERVQKRCVKGVMAGFGVGFSWGGLVAELGPLACAETIYL
jgi:3-oxoacyl-[acyl-carrier-protein] synthase-3